MNTFWNKEPPKNIKYGVSKQHIVLTNRGAFNTGYFITETGDWSCEGLLLRGERVVAFLDGVEVPVLSAPQEEKQHGVSEYVQSELSILI